jgi:hypothetical protein
MGPAFAGVVAILLLFLQLFLRPGVGRFVDLEQMLGLDLGVALGGRQAGVAEQFLDRPEIAAAA